MSTTRSDHSGGAGEGLSSPNSPPPDTKPDRRQAGSIQAVAPAKTPSRKDAAELTVAPVEQGHPWEAPDSYSTQGIDKAFKAHLARFTLGISPAGIGSKYFEWFAHLMLSPGKQLQLMEKAQR